MKSNEIRRSFLRFFEERAHRVVPSSPVVPQDDPTLLFTNAGMNQFKDVFLGREKRDYVRATSSQKCIRAGGKHNDLEQVGYTARHQTFFEMLGNFSFGDYFKREAIAFAWDFLTKTIGLDRDRLWITVYEQDGEAREIWRETTGFPDERIVGLGEKDNFWQMGDTGPCGPCTEIHYDRGAERACGPFCGIGSCDCERFMEIWNLVFMQFDRRAKGDGDFDLLPLPKPSVDTGMGLERLASILQRVESNFETDLLRPLIDEVARLSGRPYDRGERGVPHRVIADHVRALSFAFADGALPSNEGRGYVLRRILRRAANYGRKVGLREPFMERLVPVLAAGMGEAYPELREREEHIRWVIRAEEEAFNKTLDRGLELFEKAARSVIEHEHSDMFPADTAFDLYATYGFPPDLTRILAREKRLGFDEAAFQRRLDEHIRLSQAGAEAKFKGIDLREHGEVGETQFLGYQTTEAEAEVQSLSEAKGELILNRTPFYAESGGQVGDTGAIEALDGSFVFRVRDTKKAGSVIVHFGALERGAAASVKPGARVRAIVDAERRARIMKHHTATHLLHWALHEVVGEHAKQAGSVVEPDRLRFDFTHPRALSEEEIERIERLVNDRILQNLEVSKYERSLDEARRAGVTALFGEKYGERVRVVDIAGFSRELCGGTHVARTGDIGLFKIVEESAVQAGVRRIVALTGPAAVDWAIASARRAREVARALGVPEERVPERVMQLKEQLKELKQKAGKGRDVPAVRADAREEKAGSIRVVVEKIEGATPDALRARWDALKSKPPVAAILFGVGGGKVALVAAATKEVASAKFKAAVESAAKTHGGRAGGRPDMVQGGLSDEAAIEPFVEEVLRGLREGAGARA
jgi:alanyl-tRNA synthetase